MRPELSGSSIQNLMAGPTTRAGDGRIALWRYRARLVEARPIRSQVPPVAKARHSGRSLAPPASGSDPRARILGTLPSRNPVLLQRGTAEKKHQRRPVSRFLLTGLVIGPRSFSRTPVTRRLKRPYPRAPRGRASPAPELPPDAGIALLFDLAPGGVFRATRSPAPLVSSYLAFSPLPRGSRRAAVVSVALVRGVAPPAVSRTLPCGARTFLPRGTPRAGDVRLLWCLSKSASEHGKYSIRRGRPGRKQDCRAGESREGGSSRREDSARARHARPEAPTIEHRSPPDACRARAGRFAPFEEQDSTLGLSATLVGGPGPAPATDLRAHDRRPNFSFDSASPSSISALGPVTGPPGGRRWSHRLSAGRPGLLVGVGQNAGAAQFSPSTASPGRQPDQHHSHPHRHRVRHRLQSGAGRAPHRERRRPGPAYHRRRRRRGEHGRHPESRRPEHRGRRI